MSPDDGSVLEGEDVSALGVEDVSALGVEDISALEDSLGDGSALGDSL